MPVDEARFFELQADIRQTLANPKRLGVMAILMTVLTVQIIRLWPDPWAIGGFFVLMLTITTSR